MACEVNGCGSTDNTTILGNDVEACQECRAREGIARCPRCDRAYHTPEAYGGVMHTCPDCTNNVCDQCGEENHPIDWQNEATGRQFCVDCTNTFLIHRCEGECRRYFMEEEPEFDADTFLCGDCPHQRLPRWFQARNLEDWVYYGECGCDECSWLRANEAALEHVAQQRENLAPHTCHHCRNGAHPEYREEIDDNLVCQRCIDSDFVECQRCESLVPNNATAGVATEVNNGDGAEPGRGIGRRRRTQSWCQECVENHAWQCQIRCHRHYANDLDDCQCHGLYGYNFRPPEYEFLHADEERVRADTIYMGFELEVECSRAGSSKRLGSDICGQYPWLWPVHDGSLNNGLEICSHPFTFRWLKENEKVLKDLLNEYRDNGFRCYDTDTCGMHIHMTKGPLSRLHRLRIVRMVYDNPTLSTSIGQRGRKSRGVTEFASFDREDHTRLPQKVENDDNLGNRKYVAVNLLNDATMEFRFFRGTLNSESFFKNLEYVYALMEYTRDASMKRCTETGFVNWLVDDVPDEYPHLAQFLKDEYLAEREK